jgi:serine/threonine protein kinase
MVGIIHRDLKPSNVLINSCAPNFRKLSPEVTMVDRLILSCKESVPSRVYRKLTTDGLGAVLMAIKNKFH